MNKKILTRVISFVLVICLLVPIIPDLGLNLGSLTADAAMPSDGTAAYFKAGSTNYLKGSDSGLTKGSFTKAPILKDGVTYIPVESIEIAYYGSSSGQFDTLWIVDRVTVDGISCIAATHGAEVVSGYHVSVSNMNLVVISGTQNAFSGVSDADQITLMKKFLFDHLDGAAPSVTIDASENSYTVTYSYEQVFTGLPSGTSHPYLLANQSDFDKLYNAYQGLEDDTLNGYVASLVKSYQGIYDNYAITVDGTEIDEEGNVIKVYSELNINPETGLNTEGGQTSLDDMPYYTESGDTDNGYDVGGRQSDATSHATNVMRLAYLYQVTRNTDYAALALDYALALCEWEHWGAGHFLNAADASYNMALAYDWCYNVWGGTATTADPVVLNRASDRDTVRNGLFTKGVMAGIYDSWDIDVNDWTFTNAYQTSKIEYTNRYNNWTIACPWYNTNIGSSGESDPYNDRDNNWNGVCSSGMILAALAMAGDTGTYTELTYMALNSSGVSSSSSPVSPEFELGYKSYSGSSYFTRAQNKVEMNISTIVGTTFADAAAWLINNNLAYLEYYGLEQYIPDGSYIESASYWAYGTNSIFRTIAALESACGTDYGLSSAWGLDRTAYFANYVQSSNGDIWRYHDDSATGKMDTTMNALYGAVIGDKNLVGYRKYMIEKGSAPLNIFDTLKYDSSITGFDSMPLDYYMEGIEGYTMRESWENDGIYVGFMGGDNYVNHGQIDSGAFVYYNNGVKWFQDIGTENYNAYGFGYGKKTIGGSTTDSSAGTNDLMYYPNTAEGNNTLVSTSNRYGQRWGDGYGAGGEIKSYGSNDYGSYAVLDQSSVYSNVSSAKRGMLMTNDRKTVVIQDEVTVSSAQTFYWFGHLLDSIEISISTDGRTAYLTDGNSIIRCTLVSDNANLKFEDMDCAYSDSNMVLNGTVDNPDFALDGGDTPQNDYSGWHKLAVKCESVTSLKLAIVIEEIAPGDNSTVGYEWKDMSSWSESDLVSDGNSYDSKLLLSKNFDDTGIGEFSSTSGNLRVINMLDGADNAMYAIVNADSVKASNITLKAAPGKVSSASIGDGMLVTEFDLKTANLAEGEVTLAIYGTDIYPTFSIDMSEFGTLSDEAHITVVLDEGTNKLYVYVGDNCIVNETFVSKSYQDLRLVISTDENVTISNEDAYYAIDNVVMRTFTASYTALDGVLAGSSEMSSWSDRMVQSESSVDETGYAARLYDAASHAGDADDDTPIIDIWGNISSANETSAQGEVVNIEDKYVSTFEELAAAINGTNPKYTNVELYRGNTTPIQIESPITVDTNGHNFYAISDTLVCNVSGEIHTFEEGTINVTLVINGETTILPVTSTNYLSYTPDASDIGVIHEIDNGDGTYSYIATENGAWALKKNGSPLANKSNHLIVTSKNCRFYLSGYAYDGYYVTVSADGTIAPGGDPGSLFLTAIRNEYERISVTNDMYYDASDDDTVANRISENLNLYLNGFTITYYSETTSDHMFTPSSGLDYVNFYGPGTIDLDAVASNVIMQAEYVKNSTTFNNLTINTDYVITDMRTGTMTFNNCIINTTSNRTALGVSNRADDGEHKYNNGAGSSYTVANGITDTDKMPLLVINGGEVNSLNATGGNAAISISDNAGLRLEGGVVINCPSTTGAVMLRQSHGYRTDPVTGELVEDFADISVEHMYVYLGEMYYRNNNGLFCYYDEDMQYCYKNGGTIDSTKEEVTADAAYAAKLNSTDYAVTFTGTNNKVYYVEGNSFTNSQVTVTLSNGTYDFAPPTYPVASGYVLARTGSEGNAYKVVSSASAVTVTWGGDNDNSKFTEYWIAGVTPIIPVNQLSETEPKEYLADLSASSGYKYSYNLTELDGMGMTEGGKYTFPSVQLPNATIKMGMALYAQFRVSIYVQKLDGITYNSFMINGVEYAVDEEDLTVIDGKSYYALLMPDIAPTDAADMITVVVKTYDNAGNATNITATTSILNYAVKLMKSSNQSAEMKTLMSTIVDYIGRCCAYSGDKYTNASCQAIVEEFASVKSDAQLYSTKPETSAVASAVKSAYLELGGAPAFVFRFNSEFNGKVRFTYDSLDGATYCEVDVVNGRVKGKGTDTFKLALKAYDMATNITITATPSEGAAVSAVYNLRVYYTQVVQSNDELYNLLCALNAYCDAAKAYKNA